jgi:hypothetical protein
MTQTFKILKGVDNGSTWFTPASEGQVRVTRMAVDLNASGLDIRNHFYSQRVVDGWNNVPTDIKIL